MDPWNDSMGTWNFLCVHGNVSVGRRVPLYSIKCTSRISTLHISFFGVVPRVSDR